MEPSRPYDTFASFTDAAKRVLSDAQQEAMSRRQSYIGQEHLLLGLLYRHCAGAQAIENCGARLAKVRGAVEFVTRGGTSRSSAPTGFSARAKRAIELAVDEARMDGAARVRSTHLVIGIVREGEGIGAGVLASLGVTLERLRVAARLLGAHEQ